MSEKKRKCIFVIGMHRSGTSAMAGALHKLGIPIGKDIMAPNEFNEKGYFENNKIFFFNDKLYSHLGLSWDSTFMLDTQWYNKGKFQVYLDELSTIIQDQFLEEAYFLIKDPRISVLFPLYEEVLKLLDIDTSFILMIRHPEEVFLSLKKREHFPKDKCYLSYFDHLIKGEMYTREKSRLFICYDQFIIDPYQHLKLIFKQFALPFKLEDLNKGSTFIDKNLRHYSYDNKGGNKNFSDILSLYEALRKNCGAIKLSKDSENLFGTLCEKYVNQIRYFGHVFADEIFQKESIKRGNLKESFTRQLNELETSNEDKNVKIDHLTNDIQNIKLENEKLRVLVDSLQKDVDEKALDLAGRLALIESFRQELNEKEKIIESGADQNLILKSELKDLHNKSKELNTEVRKRTTEINLLRSNALLRDQRLDELLQENNFLAQEITNYRSSVSYRLGKALTAPLRYIHKLIGKDHKKLSRSYLLLAIAEEISKNPIRFLRKVSFSNLKIFFRALGSESPSVIFRNFKNLMHHENQTHQSETIGQDVIQDRLSRSGDQVLYHIDECIQKGANIRLKGWIVSNTKIERLRLISGFKVVGEVQFGFKRSDVATEYPNLLNSLYSGFQIDLKDKELDFENLFIEVLTNLESLPIYLTIQDVFVDEVLKLNAQYQQFLSQNLQSDRGRDMKFEEATSFSIIYKPDGITEMTNEFLSSLKRQEYSISQLFVVVEGPYQGNEFESYLADLNLPFNYRLVGSLANLLELAESDYFVLVNNDLILTSDAIYEFANRIRHHKCEIIYCDHDDIHLPGRHRLNPCFKPDFAPDTLLSFNYIGNLVVFSKSCVIVNRSEFQDYFQNRSIYLLLLRLTLDSGDVDHISKVLYHEPGFARSMSPEDGDEILDTVDDIQRSLSIPLGSIESLESDSHKYKFSFVILNKDSPEYIIPLVESLKSGRINEYFEVIIGDTGTTNIQVLDYYINNEEEITVIHGMEYHFSRNYNEIISNYVDGEIIGIINNDIILPNLHFLQQIQEIFDSKQGRVGAVGSKLLYPNGKVQHGGIFFFEDGQDRVLLPYHRSHNRSEDSLQVPFVQAVPAVTGAFLFVRAQDYLSVQGFDENFKEEAQDVDLCLKLLRLNKRTLFVNLSNIQHIENGTREKGSESIHDRQYFKWKWRTFVEANILRKPINQPLQLHVNEPSV